MWGSNTEPNIAIDLLLLIACKTGPLKLAFHGKNAQASLSKAYWA